jgi:taurine---2-oxoglutarate transaminase
MTGKEIVDLTKKHTLFEWSAQSKVDPIPVARAKGIYFYTPEGKRFIDFNSQLMSVNIGHGDERVIAAIHEQAQTLAYANPFMAHEPRARLGAKLAEITPGDIDTFFFTNGGAEANENAIKIARFFTGRHKIMARYRSYHGATAGAISLTGDPRRWAAEPGIPGVVRVLDPYHGIERGWESAESSLAMIEETMQLEGPQYIAAFILETVVGTNGILIPPDGYMQGVRKLCDKYGILMIADEVMAGFGRTGEWFAIDHWKVVPDLICMAKGLTASYLPLGAVGMRHHIAQHFQDKVFYGGLSLAPKCRRNIRRWAPCGRLVCSGSLNLSAVRKPSSRWHLLMKPQKKWLLSASFSASRGSIRWCAGTRSIRILRCASTNSSCARRSRSLIRGWSLPIAPWRISSF